MPDISPEQFQTMNAEESRAKQEIAKAMKDRGHVAPEKKSNYTPRDPNIKIAASKDNVESTSIMESSLVAESPYGKLLLSIGGRMQENPTPVRASQDTDLRTKPKWGSEHTKIVEDYEKKKATGREKEFVIIPRE